MHVRVYMGEWVGSYRIGKGRRAPGAHTRTRMGMHVHGKDLRMGRPGHPLATVARNSSSEPAARTDCAARRYPSPWL